LIFVVARGNNENRAEAGRNTVSRQKAKIFLYFPSLLRRGPKGSGICRHIPTAFPNILLRLQGNTGKRCREKKEPQIAGWPSAV
jgi:hypothetical protein